MPCTISKQCKAEQLFKLKARCSDKACGIFRQWFTAVADVRICNGNVLVAVAHREKDTSVHDVERHGSNACILWFWTVLHE